MKSARKGTALLVQARLRAYDVALAAGKSEAEADDHGFMLAEIAWQAFSCVLWFGLGFLAGRAAARERD